MEQMYEVLKFIEHGVHCRQSQDCVPGTLLICCLRDRPEIGKSTLFEWFRQIGTCMDQYRRSKRGKRYRCLSPYSVVISEEGGLLLLDPESPDNHFAVKRMQHRTVRAHFIPPVHPGGREERADAELFGVGRMIQMILACTRITPPLTRREEYCLMRVIDRCTSEGGRRYTDLRQMMKDLPDSRGR